MVISLIQSVKSEASGQTTPAISITASLAGSLIIVHVANDTFRTISSVTDNQSNAYISVTGAQGSQGNDVWYLWYCENANAGVTTVTVHFSAGANYCASVEEYSGVKSSGSLDTSATQTNASIAVTSPAIIPSVSGELLVTSAITDDFFLTGVSSPWTTTSAATSIDGFAAGYYINPPLSSQSAAYAPTTATHTGGALAASFLPGPTGPSAKQKASMFLSL